MRTIRCAFWIFLSVWNASAFGADARRDCAIEGEVMHWIADYCMLSLQTDDEIAASDCINKALDRSFDNECLAKRHFKGAMCEMLVVNGTRTGSTRQCVDDSTFQGKTVRNKGVGGSGPGKPPVTR